MFQIFFIAHNIPYLSYGIYSIYLTIPSISRYYSGPKVKNDRAAHTSKTFLNNEDYL